MFITFINSSHKNFPRMFNISLILLFVSDSYLLGQRYSSSFSVNFNLLWLWHVFVHQKSFDFSDLITFYSKHHQARIPDYNFNWNQTVQFWLIMTKLQCKFLIVIFLVQYPGSLPLDCSLEVVLDLLPCPLRQVWGWVASPL